MNTRNIITVLGIAASMAAAANAATILGIDINGLSAQSRNAAGANAAFGGLTHTGSIALTQDGNSILAGVSKDGVNQNIGAATLTAFSGVINLVNGGVTGGSISITVSTGSTYIASIVGGIGQVQNQAGQGFSIDGLTFNGLFNAATFANVNIAEFFSVQPLFGTLLTFAFGPNGNGFDGDSDIDITVIIPTPAAAGMGLAGLAGLVGVRRRR